MSGPAGSGKTAFAGSYIEFRGLPCLWYQVDEGDADPATFFYNIGGLPGRKLPPGGKGPFPFSRPTEDESKVLRGEAAFCPEAGRDR